MSTYWPKRIMIGALVAILFGLLTAVITEARPTQQEPYGGDCQNCHEPIMDLWDGSPHSQAAIQSEFLSDWRQNGRSPECLQCHTTPYDPTMGDHQATGLTCQQCHPSDPEEHPQLVMYTDTSSRLCGTCHLETMDQLDDSAHNQEGMDCINCHNPHDSSLRAGSTQDTCRSCHQDESHLFTYTTHAAEGLLCTDCHFQLAEGTMGSGHGRREHSFTVDMEICNDCHLEEMHNPQGEADPRPVVDSSIAQAGFVTLLGDSDAANLANEPISGPTINFIILAAIIGMLFGLIGSPSLEKWFQRRREREES